MRITDLKNVVKTCTACPAQWDAETPDGRAVYIRYRSSNFSIHLARQRGEDALDGPEIFYHDTDRGLDGYMEWDEVCEIAKDVCFAPISCTAEWYDAYEAYITASLT